ncbi:uncharacterized protein C14orf93 homolog [Poecilia formosa]|uniref:uncharacterized protein C14orf93 homolog n=1 Tax=Poecilia formosa TaxID=48698 RepID=UPI000443FB3F|nr:PREDICTED: uncharacterized protein C14orf93 homolog [Poecilia formosa]
MEVSEKRPRHLCEDCQQDLCQSEYFEQNRLYCSDGSRNGDSNGAGSDVENSPADIDTVLSAISGLSRQITQFSESLYQKLDSMDDRFVSLEQRISGLEEKRQSEPGPAETHPRKRRCNNAKLAEAVRRLHNAETNNSRYEPQQGMSSAHNHAVTTSLVQSLRAYPDFQRVESGVLISSCKTYFETIRRNFRYQQPHLAHKAASQKNSSKSRARRKRLLLARQSVLKAEELELWRGVTTELMSDEEDGELDGTFGWIVRRPSFRSKELSDLCTTLQSRLDSSRKNNATYHQRLRFGPDSDRPPPSNYSAEAAKRHFKPEALPVILE